MQNFLPSSENRHIKEKDKVKLALEEIESNKKNTWVKELKKRISDLGNMNKIAIFYRGNEITYYDMFTKANQLACTLIKKGIKKGDEIPLCVSNSPELLYILLAAISIGAKVNIFGADFNKDYINEILSKSGKKIIFVSDDNYFKISDCVKNFTYDNKVVYSLSDSLPKDKYGYSFDPYKEYDDGYYEFKNRIAEIKFCDKEFLDFYSEFILSSEEVFDIPDIDSNIEDVITITYSSGSTRIGQPKGIKHSSKGYVAMARFHDKDLSRTSSMKNIRTLSHIPPHSNTNLQTCISDTLMQGGTVAFEPIYNENFLGRSIVINKINLLTATKSHFIQTAKNFKKDNLLRGKKLPYLLAPTAVGEGTTPNEEKFINRWLKKVNAGADFLPKPINSVLSMGGGDCEHGGLFFLLFKSYMQKINFLNLGNEKQFGLIPFQLAKIAILDENGKECEYGKLGRLVANSPCTMVGYNNNDEATDKFFIKDAYGRLWADCKIWAYIDKLGNVHLKGRMGTEFITKSGKMIPEFMISDVILKDVKNILSCEVVCINDEKYGNSLVAHIEFQPERKRSIKSILLSAQQRCQNMLSPEVYNNLFFRIRDNDESFPLTGCGKRATIVLENEGISKSCLKIINNDIVSVEELIEDDFEFVKTFSK